MNQSEAVQLVSVDIALAKGLAVVVNGKTWQFSPLTFDDYAALVAHAKSKALSAYLTTAKTLNIDALTRIRDINGITSRPALDGDFDPLNTDSMLLKIKLSLAKKHPGITDADAASLFKDENFGPAIVDVVQVLANAPQLMKGEGQPVPNPTNPRSSTTS